MTFRKILFLFTLFFGVSSHASVVYTSAEVFRCSNDKDYKVLRFITNRVWSEVALCNASTVTQSRYMFTRSHEDIRRCIDETSDEISFCHAEFRNLGNPENGRYPVPNINHGRQPVTRIQNRNGPNSTR